MSCGLDLKSKKCVKGGLVLGDICRRNEKNNCVFDEDYTRSKKKILRREAIINKIKPFITDELKTKVIKYNNIEDLNMSNLLENESKLYKNYQNLEEKYKKLISDGYKSYLRKYAASNPKIKAEIGTRVKRNQKTRTFTGYNGEEFDCKLEKYNYLLKIKTFLQENKSKTITNLKRKDYKNLYPFYMSYVASGDYKVPDIILKKKAGFKSLQYVLFFMSYVDLNENNKKCSITYNTVGQLKKEIPKVITKIDNKIIEYERYFQSQTQIILKKMHPKEMITRLDDGTELRRVYYSINNLSDCEYMNESNDNYYRMFAQIILSNCKFCIGESSSVSYEYLQNMLNTKSELFLYCGEPGENINVSGFLIGRPKKMNFVGYRSPNIYMNKKMYYIDIVCHKARPLIKEIKRLKRKKYALITLRAVNRYLVDFYKYNLGFIELVEDKVSTDIQDYKKLVLDRIDEYIKLNFDQIGAIDKKKKKMIRQFNREFNHYLEMLMKNVITYFDQNKSKLKDISENITEFTDIKKNINVLKKLIDNNKKERNGIEVIRNNLGKLNLHLDEICPGQWNTDLHGTEDNKDDLIGCRRQSHIQLLSILNFKANNENGYWMVCNLTN